MQLRSLLNATFRMSFGRVTVDETERLLALQDNAILFHMTVELHYMLD